jgi:nitroimidazol reductase NimA-like FMN-containing flavoprotein (pyridoxamine 5'-phosphate oxidase superfamily)
MDNPTTSLDERFSDSGAGPTSWGDTRAALDGAEIFWISTVRADGRPHVTPLVAVWDDGALYFSTGPEEQKAVNLRTYPDVVLATGSNDWDRGLDVMVEGEARRVTNRDELERLAQAWARKWDGRWQWAVGEEGFEHEDGGAAWVYSVQPTKVLAFGKGTFSHTRHVPAG